MVLLIFSIVLCSLFITSLGSLLNPSFADLGLSVCSSFSSYSWWQIRLFFEICLLLRKSFCCYKLPLSNCFCWMPQISYRCVFMVIVSRYFLISSLFSSLNIYFSEWQLSPCNHFFLVFLSFSWCPFTSLWSTKILEILSFQLNDFHLHESPFPHFQSICIFSPAKWVSCRQHITGSFFFLSNLATLCLLIDHFVHWHLVHLTACISCDVKSLFFQVILWLFYMI